MTNFVFNPPMEEASSDDPGEWKRPDQVMQLHRLKLKKRALQARMNRTSIDRASSSINANESIAPIGSKNEGTGSKRRNPFCRDTTFKKHKTTPITSQELEASSDATLFELLNIQKPQNALVPPLKTQLTFSSVLKKLENGYTEEEAQPPKGKNYIPIDWTLNTKMRFMSPKPFAWNGKLKTSEEASGITGFVRCLDIGEKETTLDTSPNARFHRCSLVWQHPSLPWLELFPRSAGRVSATISTNFMAASNQQIKEALHREWSESFRSLFQLVRARQCPYFYVCANTFTVLFRAAGICGLSEVHALLTPTTRGFRQILKQEDIVFTMPLKKSSKRPSDTADSGCDTLDSSTSNMTNPPEKEEHLNDEDEDEDGPEDKWLQSLGVEASEIRKINNLQARIAQDKEGELDNSKESLIFVQDVEAQALFNFLINCKSAVAATGALAGIPPTLLSPVAFHGATLKPLKVRESVVTVDREKFYSLELRGPLLPHTMPSLCHLMTSSHLEQFSVSCAHINSTVPFSKAGNGQGDAAGKEESVKVPSSVFGQENLSDCGFDSKLLKHFCSPDPERIQVLESLKFSTDGYTWSCL